MFKIPNLKMKVKVKSLSRVRLFATPWTVAHQPPLSMGFSWQEYWSGLPFPSPYLILEASNLRIVRNCNLCFKNVTNVKNAVVLQTYQVGEVIVNTCCYSRVGWLEWMPMYACIKLHCNPFCVCFSSVSVIVLKASFV